MTTELPPELHTGRLVLRRLDLDDAERMTVIANHKSIARNLTSVFPHPYTLPDAIEFLSGDAGGMAITTTEPVVTLPAGLIGVVGHDVHTGDQEGVISFGYWLTPEAWGQGLATEAARAYVGALVETFAPRRIEAMAYGWNPASGRVLEKLGFTLEGRMKQRVVRFGEVTDELVYGLVV